MLESQENKIVSIIVVHYGQADAFGEEKAMGAPPRGEMLRKTMQSLYENTTYPAELIVIDNGGNPDDSEYLLECSRRGLINTYIRNKENMNFGWAWNQGASVATGDYLCFTCNDLEFKKGWLESSIEPLLKYPEKKLIATPIVTPDKDRDKYWVGKLDNHRLNTWAGSNCMLMHKSVYEDVGHFTTSQVAGTAWHRHKHKLGYVMVVTPENMVDHLAHQGGVNFYKLIPVKKTLLNKEIIDYTWQK